MKTDNRKPGLSFVIAQGSESTEGIEVKRYIGVAPVNILAVSPSKEKLEKIYGRKLEAEPNYLGKTEDGIQTVRLDFIVKADPEKCTNKKGEPIDFISKISIFLRNQPRVGSNSSKVQIIDKYGRTAWATKEELKAKKIPTYADGPARIDEDYRPAYDGEAELTDLLRAYLNIPTVERWENRKIVGIIDNPKMALCRLDDIPEYFKGNFEHLNKVVQYQPKNNFKVLFGVKTTDENKIYQDVFTRMFLKNHQTNYDVLQKEVDNAKSNGAYPNTEFRVCPLREYSIEATDFDEPEDLPEFAPKENPTSAWDYVM